ncbi:MAG: adenosylmethionine--8-amino-7-oxononanoate transaminase [Planctomycetota bacterium]
MTRPFVAGSDTIWRPYSQMKTAPPPLPIARTFGSRIETQDGRLLIDAMASWWSACHGYNHPVIVDAVQRQSAQMPHVMFGGITHEPAETLAARLVAMLPPTLKHVFFADSGSVAVEIAMKMAIGYWRRRGQPSRTRFVAFRNAYHGDTTGAMSLCDPHRGMHASYGGGIVSQRHAELPTDPILEQALDDLISQHEGDIAGVFIEPLVQGAGGMRFHDADTVRRVRAACDRHDVLLIFDEIATGFGRTGTMFAMDATEVVPDVVCVGKALTAGTIPMAATIASDDVFEAFWSDQASDAFMHGPTFMANPMACAAANASLDVFETEFELSQVHEIEQTLNASLRPCQDLPGIVDVRCRGGIGVIQVESLTELDRLRQDFIDVGIWIRPFGDCIYTTPCLNISQQDLLELTSSIVDVTTTWAHRVAP